MFTVKIFLILSILKLIQCRYLIVEVPDTENFSGRIKRDLSVTKNSDTDYSVSATKDIYKDGTQSLTASGGLYGLKPGDYGYGSAGLGLNYGNDPTSDHLAAEGKLILLNTDKHKLDASGHYNGEFTRDGKLTNFGGNIDYLHRKGHKLELSAQHSPTSDQLAAEGKVILLNTDKHKLDASGHYNREFTGDGKLTNFGGNIDYLHRNGNTASFTAQHDSNTGDTLSASGRVNLLNTDGHKFDGSAYFTRNIPNGPLKSYSDSYGANLDYLNSNGNSASLSARHIPNFGDQVAAAGKLNLYSNENHNLDATGSLSRTFPSSSYIPNYNTYGGSLDYTYRDTLGASMRVKHDDLFDRTDYSALGSLNLYRDKDSSFDLNAGLSKSYSPTFNTDWSPSIGFGYKIEY